MKKNLSAPAKATKAFFIVLTGLVIINGIALAIVQQKVPAVGEAIKTPFAAVKPAAALIRPELPATSCVDSDDGALVKIAGSAVYYTDNLEGETRYDLCSGDNVVERVCQEGKINQIVIDCTTLGLRCRDDAEMKGYCG